MIPIFLIGAEPTDRSIEVIQSAIPKSTIILAGGSNSRLESHRNTWDMILENGVFPALVIDQTVIQLQKTNFPTGTPPTFDILILGFKKAQIIPGINQFLYPDKKITHDDHAAWKRLDDMVQVDCYMVSKSGVEKMIRDHHIGWNIGRTLEHNFVEWSLHESLLVYVYHKSISISKEPDFFPSLPFYLLRKFNIDPLGYSVPYFTVNITEVNTLSMTILCFVAVSAFLRIDPDNISRIVFLIFLLDLLEGKIKESLTLMFLAKCLRVIISILF